MEDRHDDQECVRWVWVVRNRTGKIPVRLQGGSLPGGPGVDSTTCVGRGHGVLGVRELEKEVSRLGVSRRIHKINDWNI